tara:strand:- start:1465 stop:1869 length:405 start_codon:yes stop_codon:yes gene_type:complete
MHPRHAHLYAHAHVLLWPWLWWQLQNLNRWMKATGRGMLVSVDRWGNVYIRCMGDAPGAEDRFVRAPVSARLAQALAPVPCPRRMPGPQAILSGRAARGPGLRREHGCLNGLPLPHPDLTPQAPSQAPHAQVQS